MTLKIVAIGAALVLVGVLLGMNSPIAEAQRDGPYAISPGSPGVAGAIWRVNQATGQVSFCLVAKTGRGTKEPPKCSPWGPGVLPRQHRPPGSLGPGP